MRRGAAPREPRQAEAAAAAEPVGGPEFARAMAALGPFESAPRLALAVSGGSDSMALALLASAWAEAKGGEATALIVDHGLRRGSAAEAGRVRAWLRARGIGCRILRWRGAKPAANLQAAARAARYALLTGWCRKAGILHLLLAHQQDDQAETLLLRLGRGSGLDGLAAMAPLASGADLRLLRPLLDFPRARGLPPRWRRKSSLGSRIRPTATQGMRGQGSARSCRLWRARGSRPLGSPRRPRGWRARAERSSERSKRF